MRYTVARYRIQVVHVDYWRGSPHRWQNTFNYTAAAGTPSYAGVIATLYSYLQGLGAASYHGGIAEIKIYASTGGVPLDSVTYFPWDTPSAWIPYTGTLWVSSATQNPSNAEAAAIFTVPAGFSRTGKPVKLRTYWHAFNGGADEAGGPDFGAAIVPGLQTQYNKLQVLSDGTGNSLVLCNPAGLPVGSLCTLDPYVCNHQRIRGRRRKVVTIDGARYEPLPGTGGPLEAD
jgi:hypothetical protein